MKKFLIAICILTFAVCSMSQTVIITPEYSNARGFSEGLAAVSKEGKWGFIDVKGNIVIAIQYLDVRDFHEGKAAIKTENGWGYINKENRLIIPDKFFDARDFSEGLAAVKSTMDTNKSNDDGYEGEYYGHWNEMNSWQYIKEDGMLAFTSSYRDVSTFNDGYACVFNEKTWDFINKEGKVVYKTTYDNYYPVHYSDGLIPNIGGELGDEWGYSDISGKWVINPQYRSVTEFCDGIAIVEEFGGKMKVVDNTGGIVYDGKNDNMFILNGGFVLDGNNLYHKDNFSTPYATLNLPDSYWQQTDVKTIPSEDPRFFSAGVSYKAPLNILSVEILRSLKAISYRQPNEGLWATKYDNDYWGFTALKMNDFISQYVDSHMTEWLKRDEFESSSVYEKRTNEENRHKQMALYADDLINNWLKKRLDQWTLSDYNADKESFELTTDFGTYTIKVPTGNARMLKNNWSSTTKQVGFKYDNGFDLAKIDFIVLLGNKDVTLSVNTATGTIGRDKHDDINKELPSIKWLDFIANATSKECPIKLGVFSKSKIETVTVTVNGVQDRGIKTVNSSDYDMTINRTLTLNEGTNVIKVSVRNVAGTAQEEKAIVYRPQGSELASIEWLDFTATANKKEYQVKLGVKSKTKVEDVNITVNDELSGDIKTAITDGYNLTADKILSLSEGINRIVVSVRNADGISTSEKIITYQGNNPNPMFKDKRIALVIGNSEYNETDMKLANPKNDASDVAEKLKGLGFDVILKINATLEDMDKELTSFDQKAKEYDVALFYYAGHGIQNKGVNYLIPTNANNLAENNLKYKCIDMERVLDVMEDANCKLKIVILDACRNDPYSRKWHRSVATRGLSIMNAPIGTIISFSTAPGHTADDGKGRRNSPYTEAFLNTLEMPNLDVFHFFQKVGESVLNKTNKSQNPWMSASFTGEFYFNRQ